MSDFIDKQEVIDEINQYFFHIGLMAKNENEKLAITALMKDVIAIVGEHPSSSDAIPVEWVKTWIFEHPYFFVTGSTLLGDWQKEQRKEE